uniref:Uncharacterized protein n=1 Tax=Setaria digitata TaxID=48799 RepID=A0A915PKB4_9BILA
MKQLKNAIRKNRSIELLMNDFVISCKCFGKVNSRELKVLRIYYKVPIRLSREEKDPKRPRFSWHVHELQHSELALMAKIRLPNVHLETMLGTDVQDAVKLTPSTMAGKKPKLLVFLAKMVPAFAA